MGIEKLDVFVKNAIEKDNIGLKHQTWLSIRIFGFFTSAFMVFMAANMNTFLTRDYILLSMESNGCDGIFDSTINLVKVFFWCTVAIRFFGLILFPEEKWSMYEIILNSLRDSCT